MAKYFEKYETIFYNGFYARNLMSRVKLSEETKNNVRLFYPFEMKEGDLRPDIVADKYYKDPFYDWLISLCNDIVDPYYDYTIDQMSFDNYIRVKYGSVEDANATILHYKNNWVSDDSIISVSTYDALGVNFKKYWTAYLNYQGNVAGYVRKQEDWVVATNRIVELSKPNEDLSVGDAYSNGGGTGTVCHVGDDVIQVQHVTGTFPGQAILTQTVADTEGAYWSPVDAYTYELELNESKRKIKLIDSRYVFDVERELTKALKE